MASYIKAISYYLPKFQLSNARISQDFPEWDIFKISNKTGIDVRHISANDEFVSDLAFQAAEKLFAEHQIDRGTIDYLLLCTQSPDYFLPTTACILQNTLNLKNTIGALDFNLGCSGFVYGLSLAKGLIEGNMAKNVLLITSETYSKYIHPKDKSNKTIFGDAAAATLISAHSGFCQISEFVFGTDGSGAENLIVKQGGSRYPTNYSTHDVVDEFGNIRNEKNLYMNGSEIFNFTGQFVPILTNQILAKANLKKEEVDLYVYHQANQYMLNHLRKKMGIPENKFYTYMKQCGNTVSSTIPIALNQAINEGLLINKKNVILAGFGVGYSWAACNLIIK